MTQVTHRPTLFERIDAKTLRGRSESDCWIWTGARNSGGYGYVGGPEQSMLATHRVSYERYVGPIPPGRHIDHLCRNRACLNPRHLEPVTQEVNTKRGLAPTAINARLTSCRRGHPFDDHNTRIEGDGSRRCLACRAANRKAKGW